MKKESSRIFTSDWTFLESLHERDQVFLFLVVQLKPQNKVEELNRIIERQQAAIVHVWWRVFDTTQREGFYRTVRSGDTAIDHVRLIEALRLQVMHVVIGEVRRLVAF